MKYFVATDMGYDGICLKEYKEDTTAEKEYKKILSRIKVLRAVRYLIEASILE